MRVLLTYLTGPIFLISGALWIYNEDLIPGIGFLIAGALFCWVGYGYYKETHGGTKS